MGKYVRVLSTDGKLVSIYSSAHLEGGIHKFYKLQNYKVVVTFCNDCEIKLSFNLNLSTFFFYFLWIPHRYFSRKNLDCKTCIRFKDLFNCITHRIPSHSATYSLPVY